jgi:hypothetical protein
MNPETKIYDRIWFQLLAASLIGAGVGAFAGSFSRSKGAVATGALIGGGLASTGTGLYAFKNTHEGLNPPPGMLLSQETYDTLTQDRSTAAVVGVSGLIALGWGAKRALGR